MIRHLLNLPVVVLILLTSCVTINVYFPAAEAREAAREFIEGILGDDVPTTPPATTDNPGGMALDQGGPSAFDIWSLFGIGSAHAQIRPDISIKTPAIQTIQARMESRFNTTLRPHFDSGALGFGEDGMIVLRDASMLAIRDRVAVNAAVADDNRDRAVVYREIAVANNHPEWEAQIRDVFARQWVASARVGWWYQQGGVWKQKNSG